MHPTTASISCYGIEAATHCLKYHSTRDFAMHLHEADFKFLVIQSFTDLITCSGAIRTTRGCESVGACVYPGSAFTRLATRFSSADQLFVVLEWSGVQLTRAYIVRCKSYTEHFASASETISIESTITPH